MDVTLVELPSWRESAVKSAIMDFIRDVTSPESGCYVPESERIAVFDNDGTLWCEQPLPVQGFFLADRVKALAQADPALRKREPFRSFLEGGHAALARLGKRGLAELMLVTHSGVTSEQFRGIVRSWFSGASHPLLERPFTRCVFQPMLELLELLRAQRFTTFIVSGGGVDFIRGFAEEAYGIPPHQVIGSSGRTRFEASNGQANLLKLPELESFDDRDAKPVNIELHIGRRPIFAFGNSDGDLAMLRYATSAPGRRIALLLHHDDAEREFAYDRDFAVSPLTEHGLSEARARLWPIVSMKHDFNRIFP